MVEEVLANFGLNKIRLIDPGRVTDSDECKEYSKQVEAVKTENEFSLRILLNFSRSELNFLSILDVYSYSFILIIFYYNCSMSKSTCQFS